MASSPIVPVFSGSHLAVFRHRDHLVLRPRQRSVVIHPAVQSDASVRLDQLRTITTTRVDFKVARNSGLVHARALVLRGDFGDSTELSIAPLGVEEAAMAKMMIQFMCRPRAANAASEV